MAPPCATLQAGLESRGRGCGAMMTIGDYFWEAVVVLGALVVYFAPSIIATHRFHHQYRAVCVLNLLLGWTVLGWIAALIWSFTAVDKERAKEWAGEWEERRSRAWWRRGRH